MAARPLVVHSLNGRFSTLGILGALTSLKLAQPKTGPRGNGERVAMGVLPSTARGVLEADNNKLAYLSGLAGALAGALTGALAAAAGTSLGLPAAAGSVETGVASGSFHLPAAVN